MRDSPEAEQTSPNLKKTDNDLVVDSVIRRQIFDRSRDGTDPAVGAQRRTASTCDSVPDFSKHTCCFVRISDQCLSAALSVVDGVVFKCPADTWFSPTCTLDADYQAGAQVTDMSLDKT